MKKSEILLHELGDIADRTLTEEISQRSLKKGKGLNSEVDGISLKRTGRKKGMARRDSDQDGRICEIKKKISSGFYSSAEALRKIADKIVDDVSDDENSTDSRG